MKILVAGGAGFLGSHLCDRLLADGHDVTALDNLSSGSMDNLAEARRFRPGTGPFRFIGHDITAPLPGPCFRAYDRVYNLACPASPPQYQADPVHTMLTCVLGSEHLLRHAAAYGSRVLLASTSEVYGDPEQHPQAETYRGNVNTTGPRACYDEGKRAAEALAFDYERIGRTPVRVARIFNTYGPRLAPDDGRVVSNFIRQALAGEPLTIFGTGEQTRSFCYVDDTVEGLVRLMEYDGDQPGPVNIGNPHEIKVLDLVRIILDLTGSRSSIQFLPLPTDDPRRRWPDIRKAESLLDWSPSHSLLTGLAATVAWFKAQDAKP